MALMVIHHKVKDYNAWRPVYDAHERSRVSAGITNGRVTPNSKRSVNASTPLNLPKPRGIGSHSPPLRNPRARRHQVRSRICPSPEHGAGRDD